MNKKKENIIVYCVWVNGRDIDDENQHFPIDTNVEGDWHSDFKRAFTDYYGAIGFEYDEFGDASNDLYKDYIVILFSININIEKFENMFDLDFDIDNDDVQEMIPYYINYDFNIVAERISEF
jgi:hypothetical protein